MVVNFPLVVCIFTHPHKTNAIWPAFINIIAKHLEADRCKTLIYLFKVLKE